jgi:hypothetical protein
MPDVEAEPAETDPRLNMPPRLVIAPENLPSAPTISGDPAVVLTVAARPVKDPVVETDPTLRAFPPTVMVSAAVVSDAAVTMPGEMSFVISTRPRLVRAVVTDRSLAVTAPLNDARDPVT